MIDGAARQDAAARTTPATTSTAQWLPVVGVGLGVVMVRRWRATREELGADAAVPASVVVVHGLLAAATVVAAVATALASR